MGLMATLVTVAEGCTTSSGPIGLLATSDDVT